ncbi:MAG: 50S ribosome-binding GTPase [Legionella sp.]|nr:50S ribosome-binding GTPase [Legionella sp.]
MSLLEMIQKGASVQAIDNYLKPIAQKFADKLISELSTPDSRGMTPLHHAVQKGDLELVKLLLGFDASILAKMGNQTVEDFAMKLANERAESKGDENQATSHKQIYALIKSRGRWQAEVARVDGISLPRSIKAIEEAMDKVRGAEDKIGVLFFGLTGQGKSTLINFLLGVDYQIKKERGLKSVVPKGESAETARVGNSTTSETLFPQVISPKQGNYVFVDLPGFEDTRGTAEEICAAASIFMVTKQLRGIQSLLFICAWDSLADTRLVPYRRAAENVGAMIALHPEAANNFVLVVTKPEGGDIPTTVEDVRERLEDLSKNEEWGDPAEKEMKREETRGDQWRKQCIRRTTKAILSRQNSIVVMDVTKPQAREKFDQVVATLSKSVQRPDQFDFANYSRFMTQFVLVIEQMIVHYNKLVRERKNQEEKIRGITSSINEIEQEHKNITDQIEKFDKQKSQPFTVESFDKQIAAEREKLVDLRRKLHKYDQEIQEANFEYRAKEMQAGNIERDGEKLIDTLHRGWMCESTEAREEVDVTEVGDPIYVPGMGMAQQVKVGRKQIAGIEKNVKEPVPYTSSVPIQRYTDRSTGGSFTVSGFSPGAMELSGTFSSSAGARGAVSLSVELYGNISDFPGTKEKFSRLEQAAKNAKTRLEQVQFGAVSKEEVDSVSDNIQVLQLQKMAAVGNTERTQLVCETQIALLQPKLETLTKKLKDLKSQTDATENELEDLSLQISVNHELFHKLHQIVTVMGFHSETLDQFMHLYSDTPQTLPSPLKKSFPRKNEKLSADSDTTTIHTALSGSSSAESSEKLELREDKRNNNSCASNSPSASKSVFTDEAASTPPAYPKKGKIPLSDKTKPSDAKLSDTSSKPKVEEGIKKEIQKYADQQNCWVFQLKRLGNNLNIQIMAKQHNGFELKNLWSKLEVFLRKSMPHVVEKDIKFSDSHIGNASTAEFSISAKPTILHEIGNLLKDSLPSKYMTPAISQSAFFQALSMDKLKQSAGKYPEESATCTMQ